MTGVVTVPALLCDMCGQPARTWHLHCPPDKPWQVDLCDNHASDIRALRKAGRQAAGRRHPRRHDPAPSPEYGG